MSLQDMGEEITPEEGKYLEECGKELEEFAEAIRLRTGYNIQGHPGWGLVSRAQFAEPDKWPEYADRVMALVEGGKRGDELRDALFELETNYPVMT